MYSSYSRRIRWKEPKLAALRRVRSLITIELMETHTQKKQNKVSVFASSVLQHTHRRAFLQTCRRTTWAGTVEPPGESWADARRAWALEWPRCPARLPIAPESFAAVAWPWSPAPSAEPLPPHTDTPMMPAPIHQHEDRTAGSHLYSESTEIYHMNQSTHTHKKHHSCIIANTKTCSDLYVGKVNTVEVTQHLVDLWRVLQHGTCRLSQVVQRCVSAQCLRKGTNSGNLWKECTHRSPGITDFNLSKQRVKLILVC